MRFRLAARKVNTHMHTSLCVGAAEMHISTLLSRTESAAAAPNQLMEACRLSEITANISSCARRPGHCAPRLGHARALGEIKSEAATFWY
jgi:hypothetical protein